MKTKDISRTMGRHLSSSLPDLPIVWENDDDDGVPRPYLRVQMVRVSRRSYGLNGGGVVTTGYMQVTIATNLDETSAPAEDIADRILEIFPKALQLQGATGKLKIQEEPEVKIGLRSKSSWLLPVQIDYWAS